MWIRIKEIPNGEASEQVRKEWVGLVLPVLRVECYEEAESLIEPEKKPEIPLKQELGFSVSKIIAIYILAQKSIKAAQWYLFHTIPISSLFDGFMFSESEVEVIHDKEEDSLSEDLKKIESEIKTEKLFY